jgi:hypothetical protein
MSGKYTGLSIRIIREYASRMKTMSEQDIRQEFRKLLVNGLKTVKFQISPQTELNDKTYYTISFEYDIKKIEKFTTSCLWESMPPHFNTNFFAGFSIKQIAVSDMMLEFYDQKNLIVETFYDVHFRSAYTEKQDESYMNFIMFFRSIEDVNEFYKFFCSDLIENGFTEFEDCTGLTELNDFIKNHNSQFSGMSLTRLLIGGMPSRHLN